MFSVVPSFGDDGGAQSGTDSTKALIERILQSKAPAKSASNLTLGSALASAPTSPARLSVRCSPEEMDRLNQAGGSLVCRIRCFLMRVILSQQFEMFAGCLILCNFIVICQETNARVSQSESEKGSNAYNAATDKLIMFDRINLAFLVVYSIECALRLFIHGKAFFKQRWNVFDLAIVCTGVVGEILEIALGSAGSMTNMEHFQILRSMRMLRLLRAARVIISFKELYSLICGLSSCLKTLFWAAGLVFLLLTMWSILSVEYMHPLIRELAEDGHYNDCSFCADAFKDIMNANLTLFQIISGDGWGQLSRPLIANHPWTAVIIVCIIFTMVFGMLNLITAVIVDTAAQARERDVMHMAKHKEHERNEAWASFAELCVRLDENNDGEISLSELKKGIQEIPELNAYLSVLGVEDDDLEMVFDMLDANQDGKITHQEFIRQLYKIQTYELRSAHCFMKHYVEDIRKHVKLIWHRSASQASIFLGEVNQPEPELAPPSPPQDPVEASLPPADDDESPEMVSIPGSFYAKITDARAPLNAAASLPSAHNDESSEMISATSSCGVEMADASTPVNWELAAEALQDSAGANSKIEGNQEGAEEASAVQFPIGYEHFDPSSSWQKGGEDASVVHIPDDCQHFDMISPVHGIGIADSSRAAHPIEVNESGAPTSVPDGDHFSNRPMIRGQGQTSLNADQLNKPVQLSLPGLLSEDHHVEHGSQWRSPSSGSPLPTMLIV